MKNKHYLSTILLLLILIIQIPNTQATDTNTTQIIVDKHWIGIYQHDDLTTLTIEEQIFINNTGNQLFTGNISLWIPLNSTIHTHCCGNTTNTASRIAHQQCMYCFPLIYTNNNQYTGTPFTTQNPLSYFRQTHHLNITLTRNNTQIDTLPFTITLGTLSTPRNTTNHTIKNLYLTSENQKIGIKPSLTLDMHFNISEVETITIFNNLTTTQKLILQTSTLPYHWKATFWDNNTQIKNLTLQPQQQKQIQLLITTPSYITPLFIQYTTTMQTNQNQGNYTKQYLYTTKLATYYFYLKHSTGNQLDKNLTQIHPFEGQEHWDEHVQRYWFVAQQTNITPPTQNTIKINIQQLQKTTNYTTLIILITLILIIILTISLYLINKQKPIKQTTTKPSTTQNNAQHLQEMLQRINKDLAEGLIDEKTAQELKSDYERQLKNLKKPTAKQSQDLKQKQQQQLHNLQQQKKNVFEATKKLDKEYQNHKITEENYKKLRAAYKNKAIALLQEIDQLKEKIK